MFLCHKYTGCFFLLLLLFITFPKSWESFFSWIEIFLYLKLGRFNIPTRTNLPSLFSFLHLSTYLVNLGHLTHKMQLLIWKEQTPWCSIYYSSMRKNKNRRMKGWKTRPQTYKEKPKCWLVNRELEMSIHLNTDRSGAVWKNVPESFVSIKKPRGTTLN